MCIWARRTAITAPTYRRSEPSVSFTPSTKVIGHNCCLVAAIEAWDAAARRVLGCIAVPLNSPGPPWAPMAPGVWRNAQENGGRWIHQLLEALMLFFAAAPGDRHPRFPHSGSPVTCHSQRPLQRCSRMARRPWASEGQWETRCHTLPYAATRCHTSAAIL